MPKKYETEAARIAARKASRRRYNDSDKGQAAKDRYDMSPKGKAAKKRANKRYNAKRKLAWDTFVAQQKRDRPAPPNYRVLNDGTIIPLP